MDSTEKTPSKPSPKLTCESKTSDESVKDPLGKWIDILPNYFSNSTLYPHLSARTLTFGSTCTLSSVQKTLTNTIDSGVTPSNSHNNLSEIASNNSHNNLSNFSQIVSNSNNNLSQIADKFHNATSFSKLSIYNNNNNNGKIENHKYSAKNSLSNYGNGYETTKKIAITLQGSVYEGYDCITKDIVVVKRTDSRLHEQKMAFIDGKTWACNEDIIKEKSMIQFLQLNKPPKYGFVKMLDFFHDDYNYFLIMQHGGKPFRKHVVTCHALIEGKRLTINEYKRHTKAIFHQIITYVDWLHSIGVCHLDISIENLLIKNAKLKNGKFTNDGAISFCDYGLAESFHQENDFKCKKFKIGKLGYKSREVYKEIEFNAKLADIWSLGVCLFIMIIGARPFDRPSFVDQAFNNVMSGHLKQMLIDNKRIHYIDSIAIDLLSKIFTKEHKRIDSKAILKHKYCKNIKFMENSKKNSKLKKKESMKKTFMTIITKKDKSKTSSKSSKRNSKRKTDKFRKGTHKTNGVSDKKKRKTKKYQNQTHIDHILKHYI